MRVGILGTRGIPNAYGGFEQFAQYLAAGLHARGHAVYVYNSSDHPYTEDQWNGVHIIHCKDWESTIGTAGQFLYDYHCIRDAAKRDYDIVLQLGYTSSSVWHRIWPAKAIHIVNMDGLEWKRSKYNRLTRAFLRQAERWAVRHADLLVADSIGIREYISGRYGKEAAFIPYGADIPTSFDARALTPLGLTPDGYDMLMARMEPENNIELVLRGWLAGDRKRPLVLLGNTENHYGGYLKAAFAHSGLLFAGAIYDTAIVNSLRHHSHLYFHGHSVGGTNPSLLEAMACYCRIAAHDNVFNRAVLQEDAWYFSTPDEVAAIICSDGRDTQDELRQRNLEKIRNEYSWEKIIDDYEKLMIGGKFTF